MSNSSILIPDEEVISRVHQLRNEQVMLDRDLAELYGVETRVLKQAVRRNKERFPEDFMFELSTEEWKSLRSQIVMTNRGGSRYHPMAFTEQGVAMLSSVLSSPLAIQANIQIIRVFTRLRKMALTHRDILHKLQEMEGRISSQDELIGQLFLFLQQFEESAEKPRDPIGFKTEGSRKSTT